MGVLPVGGLALRQPVGLVPGREVAVLEAVVQGLERHELPGFAAQLPADAFMSGEQYRELDEFENGGDQDALVGTAREDAPRRDAPLAALRRRLRR